MTHDMRNPQESEPGQNVLGRRRQVAWILIFIVDAGFVAWGAMAAVNAIGPFELSEYLGLVLIYGALAVTAPLLAAGRPGRSTG